MKEYILISFLLVCTVTATGPQKESTTKDSCIQVDKELYVLDDNDKPVKLDLQEEHHENLTLSLADLDNRVLFFLHTRETQHNPQRLKIYDIDGLRKSLFNPKRPTKIVTHGWINSHYSKACRYIRDAFLEHDDCNVIVVDWSAISLKPYIWASNHVVGVGEHVATMIDFLVTEGMNASELTVVGHSLGAHVAGLASYYANNKANYVVALDPALPNFFFAGTGKRVSPGDGKYVEALHTNAGQLGFEDPVGDVDFYANGGHIQPGCVFNPDVSCSHLRAVDFYAESINSKKGFVAKKCKDWLSYELDLCENERALMGGVDPQPNVKGKFYFKTNYQSPYALG